MYGMGCEREGAFTLFCESINCGQRQAKVSVAGAARLKQNVPTLGGQGWDRVTHHLPYGKRLWGGSRCGLGEK